MSDDTLLLSCLNPADVRLMYNENGFIVMYLNGEDKGRVKLTRAYPYSELYAYIGVTDIEDNELGIIRELSELDEASLKAAKEELDKRYFCPVISEIISIKEKMGSFYFETTIGGRKKSFAVKDISRNVRVISDSMILIFDVDGNRFAIPDYDKIKNKTRKLLEPYLYLSLIHI